MALVRFTLDGIEAFRNKANALDAQHFCVDCAREESKSHNLVPFLDGQLGATLSDFSNGDGAMVSCDKCGKVLTLFQGLFQAVVGIHVFHGFP